MARLRRGIGRFLGVLALTGTALFAATAVAAPPAYADGASNCSTTWILCTTIQYGGQWTPTPLAPNGPGGGNSGSAGYVSSCWLQPNTAWRNANQDASSPAGLQQYFSAMANSLNHDTTFRTWIGPVNLIYEAGKNADVGIGLKTPPYNIGQSGGRWYTIACDSATFKYSDYTDIQAAMGVSAANIQYEAWFWIKDGQTPPPGVQVVTPDMLARYAANHVLLTPTFPAISPDAANLQTVNLAVKSVNTAGANGYGPYTATATLAGITSSVTAYPVTVTYTTSPSSLMSPTSVTCDFNKDGSIKAPCPTFTFTAPAAAGSGDTLIATTTWHVDWTGSTANGAAIWTHPLPGGPKAFPHAVTVQEIQTIN
jgi:hypothetical protein